MKIEKGKLYFDTKTQRVFKADDTVFLEDVSNEFTNKIAVHCPTKEDVDYLKSIYTNISCKPHYSYYPNVYIRIDIDNSFDGYSRINRDGYNIIEIKQFKEFYPDKEEQKKAIIELYDMEKNDPINPSHYNQYAIQPIDYIEANGFSFNEGNVIKYVSRYKQKNGLEDLKKARVYLDRLINNLQK